MFLTNPSQRTKKQHAELKAEYVDMLIEYQGLRDQRAALETTKASMSKSLGGEFPPQTCRKSEKFGKGTGPTTLTDNTVTNEPKLRSSVDRAGSEIYNGRFSVGSGTGERSSFESEGGGPMREEVEMIGKKIAHIDQNVKALAEDIKEKSQQIKDCKAEVEEHRQHTDILQTQIKDLSGQLEAIVEKIVRRAGEGLRKGSALSIDMYNFA